MAKIDVLLPVKNGVEFLAESLDSVQAQTFRDWRLLVLDHGSTDGSLEMAAAYAARDPRIEVHPFPEAKGLSGLLNCGLDAANAEFVMRHDADDICLPDRMAVTLAAFEADPDCVAIGGQAEVMDGAGNKIGVMSVPVGRARVTAASLFRNPVAHPTAMLRLGALRALGARYGNDFLQALPQAQSMEVSHLAEDYFLFGQLAVLGKCNNVPQQLLRYRWHGNNVSAVKFMDQTALSLAISRFLARSFCARHQLPAFDPAPFVNHGGLLLEVEGQGNLDAAFDRMAAVLQRGMGGSPGLVRELDYRRVLASRNPLALVWRYYRFSRVHAAETGEWNAVRSWLVRALPGKRRMRVAAQPA
ncbi:glycosyl transferase [Duganella sp. Leaf126]|uniref:glycosyltransferase family 2 protein n=1 Tax=Duganella sp. Leaf126 TaxID=1736266 RepID=UPI0006FEA3EE|nr:glycosyltransferase [Duganella sp. Leaf126]KQQ46344.1 glycosyl transferase [Duganella sp. Leaf126]